MRIFDSNFWIVFGLLVLLGGLARVRGGTPFVSESLGGGVRLFIRFGPVIAVSFLLAWSLAAAHRPFAWEIPILGASFASARWRLCLLVPIAVGALTRRVMRIGAS